MVRAYRRRAGWLALLGSLAVVSCGSPQKDDSGAAGASGSDAANEVEVMAVGPTEAQGKAIAALNAATGTTWSVTIDASSRLPSFLRGATAPVAVGGVTAEAAARQFLATNADLFAGFDPARELVAGDVVKTANGESSINLTHQINSVPVRGEGYRFHFTQDGRLFAIHGRVTPGLGGLSTVPALDAMAARAAAVDGLAQVYGVDARGVRFLSDETPLQIEAQGPGQGTLVYALTVMPASGHEDEVLVDANEGLLVTTTSLIEQAFGDATGKATGYFGEPETFPLTTHFQLTNVSWEYEMTQSLGSVRTKLVTTETAKGKEVNSLEIFGGTSSDVCKSGSADGWASTQVDSTDGGPEAVSVYSNLVKTRDYYEKRHGRKSIDGVGMLVRGIVHVLQRDQYNNPESNAGWYRVAKSMVFTDENELLKAPVMLDVVAHEFTHGVTQFSWGIGADHHHVGASGGLDESMSDIFGAFVEHEYMPDPDPLHPTHNVVIGEGIFKGSGKGIRDMAHPARTDRQQYAGVDNLKNATPHTEVHALAGVTNNAWYLMTFGGVNDTSKQGVKESVALGWAKSEKLMYDVESRFLHPTSTPAELAEATLASAYSLFNGDAVMQSAIQCAFISTGVLPGECACDVAHEQTPACGGNACTTPIPKGYGLAEAYPMISGAEACGDLEPNDDLPRWFRVELSANQTYTFELKNLDNDVDLEMVDASTSHSLGTSASPGTTPERLQGVVRNAGTYYFLVTAGPKGSPRESRKGGAYTVLFTAGPISKAPQDPLATRCTQDICQVSVPGLNPNSCKSAEAKRIVKGVCAVKSEQTKTCCTQNGAWDDGCIQVAKTLGAKCP